KVLPSALFLHDDDHRGEVSDRPADGEHRRRDGYRNRADNSTETPHLLSLRAFARVLPSRGPGGGIANWALQAKVQARSSVEERYLDTVEVRGSIPRAPTNGIGSCPRRLPPFASSFPTALSGRSRREPLRWPSRRRSVRGSPRMPSSRSSTESSSTCAPPSCRTPRFR